MEVKAVYSVTVYLNGQIVEVVTLGEDAEPVVILEQIASLLGVEVIVVESPGAFDAE